MRINGLSSYGYIGSFLRQSKGNSFANAPASSRDEHRSAF
jgi:hypothetical protein